MIAWPKIDVRGKTISQVAYELAAWSVAQKIREVGGNNRGPWPDFYATELRFDPKSAPWCTTGLGACFREAARQMRVKCPFPPTAKAVEVANLTRANGLWVTNPGPYCVYVLDHGTEWAAELDAGERLTDNGHVGIGNAEVTAELSANTNEAGSREGNCWAEHAIPDGGDPSAVHKGVVITWVDFSKAPLVALAA